MRAHLAVFLRYCRRDVDVFVLGHGVLVDLAADGQPGRELVRDLFLPSWAVRVDEVGAHFTHLKAEVIHFAAVQFVELVKTWVNKMNVLTQNLNKCLGQH